MTGPLKVAVAGFSAALVMGAFSGAALASSQAHGGPTNAKQVSASCSASGNNLIQDISFTTNQGTSTSLSGHVATPDHVVVAFTVPAACTLDEASIVSYQAPSGTFDANTASQQTVFRSQSGTNLAAGRHTLAVDVPACYFQVDFVRGAVIAHLGPQGSNNFYNAQGRLIASANGGSKSCSAGGTGGTTDSVCASSSPQLSDVSFLLGGSKTVSNLRGQAAAGEIVKATFTVPANCSMQLSLASYTAPLPYFTTASAPQQTLFDSQTGTFTGGVHSMSITLPTCMYQVDFVHGAVLSHFGPDFYEGRLISADNGGTTSCSATTSTPTPTPLPKNTPTPTPTPTHTTPGPVTTPTPSGSVLAVKATPTPAMAVLGTSTSTPDTGTHLAIGTAALLAVTGLLFLGLARIRPEEI
ncbi:MAG: hypothetical protein JF886_15525 [Candidatus Dormibacteraeota bacterium]|uniref:Gram-positive cocci surface proteins LPxTG domain-containing protein n=1 Tax=Candidatus Aeolococcus gillhamiae TaxID=3127015 RepID=A0A934N6U0_9BACT|nr:hypothetical protein [Candidatus Dormibacteraeota bacterium]